MLHHLLWTACQHSDTRWLGKATPRGTGQNGKLMCGADSDLWMLTHDTATMPFAGGQGATSTPAFIRHTDGTMCCTADGKFLFVPV